FRNAFELVVPAIFQGKDVTHEALRVGGDHHAVGPGNLLKAGRQVGCFSDGGLLLRQALANGFADHDGPCRDGDSDLQGLARRQDELSNLCHQVQACPHGAFSLILMGLRVAEINKHSVAHVFGDVAAGLPDDVRTGLLKFLDDAVEVLGVEHGCQRGRTHEVAKQHRELPSFGGRTARRSNLLLRSVAVECRDGLEQPFAMTERYVQLLQIVLSQVAEDVEVDGLLGKNLSILAQSKLLEPSFRTGHRWPFERVWRRMALGRDQPVELSMMTADVHGRTRVTLQQHRERGNTLDATVKSKLMVEPADYS